MPVVTGAMPSAYGIQIRLEGSAALRDGWLYVVVPKGAVRTYQGTAPAWDLMLRAGLAACMGDHEPALVSESRAARIAPLIGLTRDSSMLDTTTRVFKDTLRLDLGVPRGIDLERSWVTFELSWPIESVLATYTLPTAATLGRSSPDEEAKRMAGSRCRRDAGGRDTASPSF